MERLTTAQRRRRILTGFAAAGFFIILAILVVTGTIQPLDDTVRSAIYAGRTDALTAFWRFITFFGGHTAILAVAAALLLIPATRWRIGIPAAACAVPGYVLYTLEKKFIARPRPDAAVWLIQEHGFSFPSGHAMNSVICYGIVIYLIRRHCPNKTVANVLTVLLAVLILLIGLSRPYLGVHYPSDILGGWSMGIAWLCFASFYLDALNLRLMKKHRL